LREIKKRIRKEILEKLKKQTRKEALRKSDEIKKKLFSLPEFKKANFVMLYASTEHEVNTGGIIDGALEMGKRVALPLCKGHREIVPKEIRNRNTDLKKGTYGIHEPRKHREEADPGEIDLVVVPAVAFDKRKVRLGKGGGYYDRFLKKLPRDKITVGLVFDFQLLESLPEDSHDIPVSKVITNN